MPTWCPALGSHPVHALQFHLSAVPVEELGAETRVLPIVLEFEQRLAAPLHRRGLIHCEVDECVGIRGGRDDGQEATAAGEHRQRDQRRRRVR